MGTRYSGAESRPQRLSEPRRPRLTSTLLAVLGLLAALSPFATEFYLPAFPAMVEDLGTSAAGIQLTLSAYFVGIALGQLVFGPLSDRHGRRGPLLAGLVACAGASVACALAPSVEWLVAARFVQAFTGAAGMVISRAIVPDIAQGKAAARAFSLIFMVLGVAPVIAPILGGALAGVAGWRAIFWTYAALVLAAVVTVRLLVPESNPRERRRQARDSRGGVRPLALVLRSRAFVGNTLAFAFSFAALMAYMAASPFVFQVMGGLGPVSFGLLYGAIAVVLIASSAVSARMARSHEVSRLLGLGLAGFLAATLALGVLVASGTPALLFAVPIAAAVASLGLVFGNASALALEAVPNAAGTASAVLGVLQFGLSGVVIPLVNVAGEDTAVPLATIMAIAAAVAVVAAVWARRGSATA